MSAMSMPRIPWVLLATTGLSLASVAGRADDAKFEPRTISVNGTGKISAKPDIAEIQVGVVTQSESAREAVSANNEAAQKLAQILKEKGIEEKDVQTLQIHVMPQYSQPQPRNMVGGRPGEFVPKIAGYRVENSVHIKTREIAKLGPLLDALVAGGANQIRGINFRVEQADKLLDKVRVSAMEDAHRKAKLLASAADAIVGAPLKIEEHTSPVPPPPRAYGGVGMMAPAAAVMPVSAGEQELNVTVSVVYELLPGKQGAP
jgi:uncharacterized protein YggE